MPPVAVGLFSGGAQAQQALETLRTSFGLSEQQVGLLDGGEARGLLGETAAGTDPVGVLVSLGVAEGEARYYAHEARAGQVLVVADAGDSGYAEARDLLLRQGARDVQSEGKDLVRGGDAADGTTGRAAPQASDVTDRWEDVRSRYEMLFAQHFGTTDTTWPQAEPLYRFAWQMANAPEHRGRRWSEVEASVQRAWQAQGSGLSWAEAAGPIRDVWEDVAAEATTAEGGAERRVRQPGADQSGPASSVAAPPGPA